MPRFFNNGVELTSEIYDAYPESYLKFLEKYCGSYIERSNRPLACCLDECEMEELNELPSGTEVVMQFYISSEKFVIGLVQLCKLKSLYFIAERNASPIMIYTPIGAFEWDV